MLHHLFDALTLSASRICRRRSRQRWRWWRPGKCSWSYLSYQLNIQQGDICISFAYCTLLQDT